MKKLRIISLVVVLVLAVGLFAGCNGGKEEGGSKTVIWYVEGTVEPDNEKVFKLFNERLGELTDGLQVEFKYIDAAQYDLQFSSGDEFDLIQAPDHKGYWANVEKGAFMEVTEEELKEYAPYIWENGQEFLDTGKFNGKYYAIPGINKYSPDRTLVARGDYMDKYGIDSLDTIEDIDKFVMTAAKDKSHNIVPFNAQGGAPWMIFNMWASDWGWAGVGSLSFAEHYYYNTNEDTYKIFLAIDQPEVIDFSNTVKSWYDGGVFSKSVLSNNTSCEEAFKNGKSLLAWTSSPSAANSIYREIPNIAGADKWDIRFYSMYSKQQRAYNYMNCAVAISRTSKNKANALRVLNAIYANEDLYKIITAGIEGEHYQVDENGYLALPDSKYACPALGIRSHHYTFPARYDYPYADDLVEELKNKTISDPLVNCPIQAEGSYASMKVKLTDVYSEYTQPRVYGAVDNVEAAIERERKALKAADIDEYMAYVQVQVDKYVAEHPEAMENFRKSRDAVKEYNKKNPHKTNPKDYK